MATGIFLLILGVVIMIFTIEVYYYHRQKKKTMDDVMIGGLLAAFLIAGVIAYAGADKIDMIKNPPQISTEQENSPNKT